MDSVDNECSNNDTVINKITPRLVNSIIHDKIKSNKADVDADLTTDCFKNAPPVLSVHLSLFLKSCLSHSYISANLLVCCNTSSKK